LGIESDSELEKSRSLPIDYDLARVRAESPGEASKEGALPGPVASDDPECLAPLDLERDIRQGSDVLGLTELPTGQRLAERRLLVDELAETHRQVLDQDRRSAHTYLTMLPSDLMNTPIPTTATRSAQMAKLDRATGSNS